MAMDLVSALKSCKSPIPEELEAKVWRILRGPVWTGLVLKGLSHWHEGLVMMCRNDEGLYRVANACIGRTEGV